MNREHSVNTLRGKSPQRLEGSRFAIRQLCNLAASGSRERLVVVQVYPSGAYPSLPEQRRLVKALRCDVSGSRLSNPEGFRWLPSHGTNALRSGSPPGSVRSDSRTGRPTKPKLYSADRSSRPRKRGALHNQDVGEVGRTTTSTRTRTACRAVGLAKAGRRVRKRISALTCRAKVN
jgi:hypothetical protein